VFFFFSYVHAVEKQINKFQYTIIKRNILYVNYEMSIFPSKEVGFLNFLTACNNLT